MAKTARAAICRELDKPVVVERITVDSPHRGEVMVKLAACGVCHSDLSATNGTIALKLPLILGHEAAGEVIEVGEGVEDLALGDHVISSFIYMCGKCRFCAMGRPVLCLNQGRALTTLPDGTLRTRDAQGNALNIFSGCGVMAEYATLSVENVVKIDSTISLACAALVGCAVTTGVGAVFNTARVVPGSSVAVFGCGGIGLNVIQGARIAGAVRIVAIDTLPAKLEMAKQFGATDTLQSKPGEDLVKPIKKLTNGGADYAFECVGSGELAALAYRAIGRGGIAVVVGVAKPSDSTSVRTMTLPFEEKTLTGSYYGSCVPRVDFPRLLALYMAGRLKLEELITHRYTIEESAQAFADLEPGKNARGVIVF
ncbi:MAG TPA: Zn-dependent alcohol dehydrogenase [Steroidobacteraceae bacterium]|jgi:S-(hydroxymethyl)glutathione dehydrogenase/alcohol dehydrogenase|nr:Zn-dependent alcohol dehydrogenase [Steroidobacteraceae bacterium]